MSTSARPMCTVSFSVVAGAPDLLSIGGSKLLPLALSCATAANGACAARNADRGACVGAAGGAGGAAAGNADRGAGGGCGGFGSLCADAGRALSGMSTALPVAAVCSAGIVVPLINSCSSVL